jgi:hypothetical protein
MAMQIVNDNSHLGFLSKSRKQINQFLGSKMMCKERTGNDIYPMI